MSDHSGQTPQVVELIGNPRAGSRTRTLAQATTAAALAALADAGTVLDGLTTIELAEAAAVSFGPGPAQPVAPIEDVHGIVRRARLLVVATPTYKGSYTGLLKVFLDQYGHRELAGVVAIPVAIAAAQPHRVAVAAALQAVLAELGATVPGPPLAALESTLDDPKRLADEWIAEHGPSLIRAFS